MVSKNKDFKIREYHVIDVRQDGVFGWAEWDKLQSFTSLSKAVSCAKVLKELNPECDYRVVGEFDYEEI